MNKTKEYECEQCRKKISDDYLINLPCGYLICLEHVTIDTLYKCHFCPNHTVVYNDFAEMHKNKIKLQEIRIREKIDDLKERKTFLMNVQKDPKSFIGEAFTTAIKTIDARKDTLIDKFIRRINECHDDLVKKVKDKEKLCVNELKNILSETDYSRLLIDRDQNNNICFDFKEGNFLNRANDSKLEPITELYLRERYLAINSLINQIKSFKFEPFNKPITIPDYFGRINDTIYLDLKSDQIIDLNFSLTYPHENEIFMLRKIDYDRFASVSKDCIKIWQKSTGKCLKVFKENGIVCVNATKEDLICYFENGNVVAKCISGNGQDRRLVGADYTTKTYVRCIELVGESEYFSGLADGGIFHFKDFVVQKKILINSSSIVALKYIENINFLLSSSKDDTLRLLKVNSGDIVWSIKLYGESRILESVNYLENGAIAVSENRFVKLYDLNNGQLKAVLCSHEKMLTGFVNLGSKGWFTSSLDGTICHSLWPKSDINIIYKSENDTFTSILYFGNNDFLIGSSKYVKLCKIKSPLLE
ncbi:unnamed protein product [Brachionus calyciflorus]|uniref:Uncharacterized protein n=1 Tax=Brachionus calyciflorus TaxID=104777 RepID=A0A814HJ73_9BILA|nr:unnamed protein product [Brachionus calyciflorus]